MVSKLFLKKSLSSRLILVDGISRSGKMLSAKLISNFEGMEYFQYNNLVEHIPALLQMGLLDNQTARCFLRLELDSAIYDQVIGRNLNTREDDSSSVLQALNHQEYTSRTKDTNNVSALDRFYAEARSPIFLTHETLQNIKLFFSITEDLKVIEIMRHPVDLAFSWFQRGWGNRWGIDPIAFSPTLEFENRPVPFFAAGWPSDYLALEPVDRIIKGIISILAQLQKSINELSSEQQKSIHFFSYEYMLIDPEKQISNLAKFLRTKPLNGIERIIARENLPKITQDMSLHEKWTKLEKIGTNESLESLLEAGRCHEDRWDLPPLTI